ncbi:MAG: DUF86 domain-containing protein [Parcubacteria group bacterium]|jgi:uncharacterized protein with HEPN domain
MRNDLTYLKHINDSVNNIINFSSGADRAEFDKNRMMVSAIIRELEIIGEAANNVSSEFREAHPEIPWRDMIDMRNVLIHEYFGVIVETVWETCRKNIPELAENVSKIISQEK